MSKNIVIIPARMGSTRFPGKVLEKIGDKSILNLVWENVKKSSLIDEIIIATDDERVLKEAESFGAQAEMTFSSHKSGTDRCAQVSLKYWSDDIVINVQADEPFIDAGLIDLLVRKMNDDDWIEISTLCTKIDNQAEAADPNIVKLVKDKASKALYFSRASLPFYRDGRGPDDFGYKHIGIYGFRNKALQAITQLEESYLEKSEKLEQLRWMENGFSIHVFETEYKGIGIDTPEDLEMARRYQ
ncbi:MAG: 3-deoxy-manno-octulosonate cytidylyltransferase [Deltaproteobacteria bacterium]